MVFHWDLSDSMFPQVFRILLNILADFNNIVVWKVSTRPLICLSSSSWTNLLVTIASTPIAIGITVTFMCYSFFSSLARSMYLSFFFFFAFFQFYPVVSWNGKVHYSAGYLWILTSAKLFPSAVSSTLFIVISINFMVSLDALYCLRLSIIHLCRTISYAFLVINPRHSWILRQIFLSLRMCWSIYSSSPVPMVPLWHPFCSSGNNLRLIKEFPDFVRWDICQ